MKDKFISLICDHLDASKEQLKEFFFQKHSISIARYFVLDNFLPTNIAENIYNDFPPPKQMQMLHNRGELKLRCMHIKQTSALLQDLHYAIQDPQVISMIEYITEIKNQVPDTSRLSGGISLMTKSCYINPHLDNSHDVDKKYYRTVNFMYYISPNWMLENGGNYELWDVDVKKRIIVPCLFNRLLVMETNNFSWHSVNPVLSNKARCCFFNYYFSEQSPTGKKYFHTASSIFFNPVFKPRPEQKISRTIDSIKGKLSSHFKNFMHYTAHKIVR